MEFDARNSALLRNMSTGSHQAVQDFLQHEPRWLWHYYCGESLLHIASDRDHPSVIEVLLALGLDVDTPEEDKPWGPLLRAVHLGNIESARCLLKHGASTTYRFQGKVFSCGTLSAVARGDFELVQLLVEHGAPVDILADDPPRGLLTMAIDCGHTEIAEYLRSKGALEDDEIRAKSEPEPKKAKKKTPPPTKGRKKK